jgi:hypothetical protein
MISLNETPKHAKKPRFNITTVFTVTFVILIILIFIYRLLEDEVSSAIDRQTQTSENETINK